MPSKYLANVLATAKPETERFVQKNLDLTEQILMRLAQQDMTQRDLARAMGQSEPEISRMLSGAHNFTLKTLTKMEAVLGEDIILTPMRAQEK
jgi:plasmid maintenance system antidote protein VapI